MLFREGKAWNYAMFAVVVLATSLGGLSQTALNAMLVAVCDEFGVPVATGQWLTTIYIFLMGAVVPLSSYLMGRFRLKDLVALGLGLFLASALLAACSTSFAMLLAARVLQAVATGVLMPLVQTFAMTRFPGRAATAMGISGIAMGFAPNVGPTVGGAMVDAFGWRSLFWLLFALAATILAFLLLCIKRRDDASYPAGFDLLSFILCTLGLSGILVGCSEASSFTLGHPLVWGPVAAGAAVLAAFVVRQRRMSSPFVNMGIFRERSFVVGFIALIALNASFIGITMIVPLYVQNLCGGTALQAGMVLFPGVITALICNPLSGLLTDKIGVRPVTLVAGAFLAVGATSMAFVDASTPFWLVAALQGVRQVGVSSLISPLTSYSLRDLKGKLISDGSGFGLAVRQTSASVGTALMVFALEGAGLAGAAAFHAAFGVSAAFSIITLAVIAAKVR